MTVLVTGGAGYVGSHTVRALRDAGTDVVVLDSLEYGHREAVLGAPLEVGDIAEDLLVHRIVEQYAVDSVVHFAAYKAAGESMEVPQRYFENNVARTARLLAALESAGVRTVVFSSTCAVYGTPRTLPVDEEHPTGPESPYGESKRIVEQMLAWFDRCHGMRSVSLRYFNAAGASADAVIGEDNPKPLNLVPLAMQAALGQLAVLTVNGTDYPTPDGSTIRD
ncbi:MAG TPA: NAD-dependent epimerase/dehydratase family protein, partial [Acidimicrobiia bacterium]|nr:NAD-dependent epimerase/dehydratase family protein [Acidimicrobiia bacterium]